MPPKFSIKRGGPKRATGKYYDTTPNSTFKRGKKGFEPKSGPLWNQVLSGQTIDPNDPLAQMRGEAQNQQSPPPSTTQPSAIPSTTSSSTTQTPSSSTLPRYTLDVNGTGPGSGPGTSPGTSPRTSPRTGPTNLSQSQLPLPLPQQTQEQSSSSNSTSEQHDCGPHIENNHTITVPDNSANIALLQQSLQTLIDRSTQPTVETLRSELASVTRNEESNLSERLRSSEALLASERLRYELELSRLREENSRSRDETSKSKESENRLRSELQTKSTWVPPPLPEPPKLPCNCEDLTRRLEESQARNSSLETTRAKEKAEFEQTINDLRTQLKMLEQKNPEEDCEHLKGRITTLEAENATLKAGQEECDTLRGTNATLQAELDQLRQTTEAAYKSYAMDVVEKFKAYQKVNADVQELKDGDGVKITIPPGTGGPWYIGILYSSGLQLLELLEPGGIMYIEHKFVQDPGEGVNVVCFSLN